ncbi:MAG: radical SAM protein [Proteobacteria bacterium]|jgi:uncharacterized protein|nr:radical SAM protein [Pseudomonadota bacterium]
MELKELKDHTLDEAQQRLESILDRLETKEKPSQEETYFMNSILDGVERCFIGEIRQRQALVPGLRIEGFGHLAIWGGELSPGCQHCLDHGFAAIQSASDCNLKCRFCYYGDERPLVRLLGPDKFEVATRPVNLDQLKVIFTKAVKGPAQIQSIAWVFLEPFTVVEKHEEIMAFVHELGIYQHLYTNGTLCTRDNLKTFASAGLDEIRFNLAATNCSDQVIEAMHWARELYPCLCVESPMVPEYFDHFKKKWREILGTGVSHIHCAEVHLNGNNFTKFHGEPMYQYSRGYISPLSSRRLTYDLMDLAVAEGWKNVTIHDCSNEAKFYRGASNEVFGANSYEAELPGMPMWWFPEALQSYPLTKKM